MHELSLKKIKKGISITNAFRKNLNESNRKPNKIWVYKGSEFYNRIMKSWLEKKMLSKCVQRIMKEKFTRTLKNKIYKYMTSI